MHVPPRVRGGVPTRSFSLVLGLFLFAVGVVLQLESKLGLSPWDTLHQGISKHTPLSFGAATVTVSFVVVGIGWALGARIGVATVANAVLVGGFIQVLTAIPWVEDLSEHAVGPRIGLLVVAMVLFGLGSALYLGAWMGAGPRDSLMVVLGQRSGIRLGVVRTAIELCALALGWSLGGTVGIGTAVFALGIGPALEGGMWVLQRSRFGAPAPAATPVPAPLAGS